MDSNNLPSNGFMILLGIVILGISIGLLTVALTNRTNEDTLNQGVERDIQFSQGVLDE